MSKSQERLEGASKAVTCACKSLVRQVQRASSPPRTNAAQLRLGEMRKHTRVPRTKIRGQNRGRVRADGVCRVGYYVVLFRFSISALIFRVI